MLVTLYEYVKKKNGYNFHQLSELNKIKHLSEYLSDVIEYFELKIEKLKDEQLEVYRGTYSYVPKKKVKKK